MILKFSNKGLTILNTLFMKIENTFCNKTLSISFNKESILTWYLAETAKIIPSRVGCARQSGVKISSFSCRTNRKTGGGGGTIETALLVAVRLKIKMF